MERGLMVIGFAWLVVLGTFDAGTHGTWDDLAITIPSFAPDNQFELIGGWTW